MFLISRCCTGARCRYKGTGYLRKIFLNINQHEDYLAICPEELGGLPTPREGCFIQRSIIKGVQRYQVLGRRTRTNYTYQYVTGAKRTLMLCQKLGIRKAYLLKGSPACGIGYGITAMMLKEHGIEVIPI